MLSSTRYACGRMMIWSNKQKCGLSGLSKCVVTARRRSQVTGGAVSPPAAECRTQYTWPPPAPVNSLWSVPRAPGSGANVCVISR